MPVFRLGATLAFPLPEYAEPSGLLAVGGDLRPERVLLAYRHGIFPWPHRGQPLLWFSPDPRTVLRAGELHVARRLARELRHHPYEIRLDTAFDAVMRACATVRRKGQRGTWITPGMIDAYTALHHQGYAHACEAWLGSELVGGVYGVCVGRVFTAESMFMRAPWASKIAVVTLIRQLDRWGIDVFDAEVHSPHVAALGARDWPRDAFLAVLRAQLDAPDRWPTRRGPWRIDPDLAMGATA